VFVIEGSIDKETSNTFPVPEIIYDPSLVLSPHVFLLGLILADGAFAAPNLTSAEQLSKLDIRPGTNQLPLPLKRSMDDIPIFRKSITTTYGTDLAGRALTIYNPPAASQKARRLDWVPPYPPPLWSPVLRGQRIQPERFVLHPLNPFRQIC
jgi:Protein of unknown function (DUF3435)